jgi:hypothetical protein
MLITCARRSRVYVKGLDDHVFRIKLTTVPGLVEFL